MPTLEGNFTLLKSVAYILVQSPSRTQHTYLSERIWIALYSQESLTNQISMALAYVFSDQE